MTPFRAAPVPARLDHRSRAALRQGALFAGVLSLFVLLPWLTGRSSGEQLAVRLITSFTVAASVMMAVAMQRRERAGQGSLNGWDISLAFNGVAVLVHILNRI